MKPGLRPLLASVAALILLSSQAVLSQEPVIQAYTQVRSSAFIATDAEGRPVPVDMGTALFRALMAEAELDYSITLAPWARNIQALDTRPNVLAYTFVRSAEREQRYYWVGLVQDIRSHLYGLRDNLDQLPESIDQARSFRVGSIRDDAYDNLLHRLNFNNIVHINNNAPWLTLMERGRIDLLPYNELAMQNYLQQQGRPTDIVVPVVELADLSTGLYFALSKLTDERIYQRLRQAYIQMVANGEYERIVGEPHPNLPNSVVISPGLDASN